MIPDPAWRTKPWGVIADDLTGATDTAAAFARAGFRAMVILDRARARGLDAQVLILSSHSRQCPPALARRRVQAACRWLRRRGAAVIYKKMDSTLHGNIAAEVAAIRDAAG
ncbi:MAG TPA: four-carbon acid sugar kinase family protein, partial [Candidatus Dormibacteraeota bacterium]|nr:four-carbon acid sugar kinase family protein [Candidatus Dormibacteraeota bacterium]